MYFNGNAVSFHWNSELTYMHNGMRYTDSGISNLCTKNELLNEPSGFKVRMTLKNPFDKDILLESAFPLVITQLQIGSTYPVQLQILNEGRHKNDLPAVFYTDKRDDAFSDAVNHLSESGQIQKTVSGATTVYGDQISILHANDASLTVSFLSADIQLTEISIELEDSGAVRRMAAGGGFNTVLRPGATIQTDWVRVDTNPDSIAAIDRYSNDIAQSKHIEVPEKKPSVYSTWYYYGTSVTSADVRINLDGIKTKGLPFTHFQIDDGWQVRYGDWQSNSKFPQGMETIADSIREHGMQAGIWTCPLIADIDSELAKGHPDWFLRKENGEYCFFPMGKSKYHVLDCTNDHVIEWITTLYRTLRNWGYTYHKLDFTRAFPLATDGVFKNPHMTTVQAYVRAMQAVRKGIGPDGYLLVCGGLYQPLAGIADAQRTGSDVTSMWFTPGGTPKIPFTVKQNILRSYMNRWWHNDPDSLMVRRKLQGNGHLDVGMLSDDEALTFTANQYYGGGLLGSTEPMDLIEDDRLYLLRHVMPVVHVESRPTYIFNGSRFPDTIDVRCKNWHTICFVNWTNEPKRMLLVIERRIVENDGPYIASAFLRDVYFDNIGLGDTLDFGVLAPHATEIVKIASANIPQIVKSDGHFSMGGEAEITWKNGWHLSAENKYPIPLHYTVRMPDGSMQHVEISPNSKITLPL